MSEERLQRENDELRRQLAESQETLQAIRTGAVDAFVIEGAEGHQIYTLEGADRPYRILVENMQQGAVTLDASGNIVYCNIRFATLLGIPHERLVGTGFREFVPPEGHAEFEQLLARATQGTGQGELDLQASGGKLISVFLTLNALPPESGVCIGVLVTDLTAQRHREKLDALLTQLQDSEARFRQLADVIPQLAWTANADGHIDWYNNRWYEFTGTTFEAMQGWGWQAVHDPEVLPSVLAGWRASIATGKPFEMVFPIRGADGTFNTFLTKVMPFCDSNGNVVRWFGTNTDISEQHKLQNELRQIAAASAEADRRKDEFLATLAHELRNPLSPIKTATQLMRMIDGDIDQFRELCGVIDRQTNQMVRLIDDLMDVSRISRGKITLQLEPCALEEVVTSALEAARPFIEKAGHRFHVQRSADAMEILGDAARLAQVLVNLLNNAAKYTPSPGDIWLNVSRENDHALIQVRDNGEGIDATQLSIIFNMFEQLETLKQHGQSGLGIGLSLVKTLVELHDGQVTVESAGKGCGSTFEVRLPLKTHQLPPSRDFEIPVGDAQVTESTPFPTGPLRVLVVEDIKANRFILVQLLRAMGHEVDEAVNGREGVERALAFKPDVILSDISMPVMNGHEMARELRACDDLQGVKLVALTGYGQDVDRHDTASAGFDAHLVKPAGVAALSQLFGKFSEERSHAKPR